MKKDKNFWMLIFILSFPFIDFITSILTWSNMPSIGLFMKGAFLLYALYYILKNTKDKKRVVILFFLCVIYSIIHLIIHKETWIIELTNLIKIFYFPILILFFKEYENPLITKKTIFTLLIIYLLLYLVPYPFGLGHNISEIYPNKDLYLSYFYIGNEIVNVFIILIPISILYLIEENKKIIIPFIIIILFLILILGTKAMYLSILLMLVYFIIHYRNPVINILKKHSLKIIVLVVVIISISVVFLPKTSLYNNIKTSLEHYEITNITELFTLEKIDNIIYSNRLTFLKNINEEYQNSNMTTYLFGLGRNKINEIKNIEIDLFDIFYSIGILGIILYVIVFMYVLKDIKFKSIYKFILILLFIISLFSGHVLISPMVSTYLGLLPLINKNEKE